MSASGVKRTSTAPPALGALLGWKRKRRARATLVVLRKDKPQCSHIAALSMRSLLFLLLLSGLLVGLLVALLATLSRILLLLTRLLILLAVLVLLAALVWIAHVVPPVSQSSTPVGNALGR